MLRPIDLPMNLSGTQKISIASPNENINIVKNSDSEVEISNEAVVADGGSKNRGL